MLDLIVTERDLETYYDSFVDHISEAGDYFEDRNAFDRALEDVADDKRPKLVPREPKYPFMWGLRTSLMPFDFLRPTKRRLHDDYFMVGHCITAVPRKNGAEIKDGEKPLDMKLREDISEKLMYSLKLEDPFFESLKKDYDETLFKKWWEKCCKNHRKAWVYTYADGSIGAILIYKIEDESIGGDPLLPKKKRLKICTLKVNHRGNRIGELFLKLSFSKAISEKIDEVYLTHFVNEDQIDPLMRLMHNAGFYEASSYESGEKIFLKHLKANNHFDIDKISPLEIDRLFYPSFYDGKGVNKFIIPIRPEWHDKLFIESKKRQTKIEEHFGGFIIEGNTIEKAYLSHSKIKKIKPADIVIFYRSRDQQEITSIGLVHKIYSQITDKMEIIKLVGNRTVYSEKDIAELAKKPVTIILFRWHFNFKKNLDLKTLKKEKILNAAPQTISELDHSSYEKIKNMTKLDKSFTINK